MPARVRKPKEPKASRGLLPADPEPDAPTDAEPDAAAPVLRHRPDLGENVWVWVSREETVAEGDQLVAAGVKAEGDMLVERRGLPGIFRLVRAGERIPRP